LPRLAEMSALPDELAGGRSASAAVADALRRAILRGTLPAGERLRQDAVASRFGVSQMIVREAFKQLVNERILHAEPRRGVSVAALSVREVEETTQLRSLIEAQALAWAIPQMKESDLNAAERILDELDKADSADDIISLDTKFHQTLYAPARREQTLSMIKTLRFNFERYFRFAWEGASHLGHAQGEHREILKCCRDRTAEKACVVLRKHILGTGTPLLERLKELETESRSVPPKGDHSRPQSFAPAR
jgi:DNA-binding GntR family transcriptional regulator